MVVTGLLYSRAARDGLGVQVVDHAGLRGQPTTWQQRGLEGCGLTPELLGPAASAAPSDVYRGSST